MDHVASISCCCCTGGTRRMSSIESTVSGHVEEFTEPPVETVRMMLIMLRPDAVEGFYHQVLTSCFLSHSGTLLTPVAAVLHRLCCSGVLLLW